MKSEREEMCGWFLSSTENAFSFHSNVISLCSPVCRARSRTNSSLEPLESMDFVTQKYDNSVVGFSESDMSDSSESHFVMSQKGETKGKEESKKKESPESAKKPDYLCSSEEEDLLFPVGRSPRKRVVGDSIVEGWHHA